MLVLFVHSACTFCGDPEFVNAYRRSVASVRGRAEVEGVGFLTLGVALDADAMAGVEFLERYGSFDQISSGYGWANAIAVDFRGMPLINEVPQIVVWRRVLMGAGTAGVVHTRNQRLVARMIGLPELAAWLERGTPLPAPSIRADS